MEKIKVIIDRTEPGLEEIRQGMDFNKLAGKYTAAVKTRLWVKKVLMGALAAGTVVVAIVAVNSFEAKQQDEFVVQSGDRGRGTGDKHITEAFKVKPETSILKPETSNIQSATSNLKLETTKAAQARYGSLQEFYKARELKPQYFTIDASRDTMIKGKQGTELYIKAGSFVDKENKPVVKDVQLELKECYALEDMLRENLGTMAGKEILQSGGMIWLGAKSGEKELQLKKFAEIEMISPSAEAMEDTAMFIYYGEKNNKGELNWKLDKYSRIPYPVAVYTAGTFHDTAAVDFFRSSFRFMKKNMVEMIRDTGGLSCTMSFNEMRKVIGAGAGHSQKPDNWQEPVGELSDLLSNCYCPFIQPMTREASFTFKIMEREEADKYMEGFRKYQRLVDINKDKSYYFASLTAASTSYSRRNASFFIGQIGWINVDKPIYFPRKNDEIVSTNTVRLKKSGGESEKVQLIINAKKQPSIVYGMNYAKEEIWIFPNIPVDAQVILKGTLLKDGVVYQAEKNIKVGDKERVRELEYSMPSF